MYKTVLFEYYNRKYYPSRFNKKFETIEELAKDIVEHGDKPSREIDNKLVVDEQPLQVFKTVDGAFIGVYAL